MLPQILQRPFPRLLESSTFSKPKVTLTGFLPASWPQAQSSLLTFFVLCTLLSSQPPKRPLDQGNFFLPIFSSAFSHSISLVQLNIDIPSSFIPGKYHYPIPPPLFSVFAMKLVRSRYKILQMKTR